MAMLVEMVSDLVCPWCWLGLRRLEGAIAQLDDPDAIDLRFRPFQLAPELPPEGVPYKDFMRSKFGASQAATSNWIAMQEALIAYGTAENIPYRFDGIERRPNTVNAHRLVRWAQGQGLGAKAKETLFNAYFNLHLDIGDPKVLVQLAETIGLYPDVVEKLLGEDADLKALAEEEKFYRSLGVAGVPTYIVDGRFAMQGAQSSADILALIKRGLDEKAD